MYKISVYTILFHDLQFYDDIIKHIYNFVDEIIVVDGPYAYAVDNLKKLNLFYDENEKPIEIDNIINKYSKIKYTYAIHENEEEKRIYGYNKCSNDIVLLIDTDEFLHIDINNLQQFIMTQNKYVGCSNIYNMCDYNINYNALCKKYILFKKSHISAIDHLNYLWLVGCKQDAKVIEYMDDNPIGTIYHQTLNRNKQNNIVKFVFYVLLYRKNMNQQLNLLDNYDNDILLDKLSYYELLNIFAHCDITRINIPSVSDQNILELNADNFIPNLCRYNNSIDFYFSAAMKCIKNIPVCFRLPKKSQPLIICFENSLSVDIKLYNIHLNTPYEILDYKFQNIDDKITLHHNITDIGYYLIVQITCHETKDDNFVFTITNVTH